MVCALGIPTPWALAWDAHEDYESAPSASFLLIQQNAGAETGPTGPEPVAAAATGQSTAEKNTPWSRFSLSYFGLIYGPGVFEPGEYQPDSEGKPDLQQPVFLQNHLNLNHALTETVTLSVQGAWLWQPVLDRHVEPLDPSLRLSDAELLSSGGFSLYSDLRSYLPASGRSRQEGLVMGLQTFQIAQYTIPGTALTLGSAAAFRYNFRRKNGFGRRMETYLAPSVTWQAFNKLALYTLAETGGASFAGDPVGAWSGTGTAVEPGFRWDLSDRAMISPYVNFRITEGIRWRSAQLGMMLYWNML